MLKKSSAKIFFILGLAFVILISACDNEDKIYSVKNKSEMNTNLSEKLAAEISKKAENKDKSAFDIKAFTNFDWDKLFVFNPYTPQSLIAEKIGNDADQLKQVNMDEREDINLLVFTNAGKIVEFVEFPRSKGDFDKVSAAEGFRSDEAKFTVTTEDREGSWVTVLPAK